MTDGKHRVVVGFLHDLCKATANALLSVAVTLSTKCNERITNRRISTV
ncbi:hypothetical protein HMPREF3192_00435 [Atopobium deltae]|uniref:Uncharacterized protein n=1 Tax=Atopobium deltae TaxID=1393034 RepID=A0A133XVW1_9ACTN|nr:hypothetical protein HMPREF3192_00435 [Atopobium deltae]